jgi:hypothetical protein
MRYSRHLPWGFFWFFKCCLRFVAVSVDPYCGDRSQEAVAAACDCLDESRIFSRISKGITKSANGRVKAVVEIHEGVGRPEPIAEFLARDDIAGSLQQVSKNLEGLFLQFDTHTTAAQFASSQIELEQSKAQCLRNFAFRCAGVSHRLRI